jgi:phage terminase large subunit-like protein
MMDEPKNEYVSGHKTDVRVWEEYIDDRLVGWVSWYPPLDLYSQGTTKEEAVDAMREMLLSWAAIVAERLRVVHDADRVYKTGVHIRPRET